MRLSDVTRNPSLGPSRVNFARVSNVRNFSTLKKILIQVVMSAVFNTVDFV